MDFLKEFDRVIESMKRDAEGKPELLKEVKALEAERPRLVEALLAKNTRASMEVIEDAFRVEKKVHGKKPAKGFAPEEKAPEKEEESAEEQEPEEPAEEKELEKQEEKKKAMEEWDKQRLKEIEEELKRIEEGSEDIRADWARFEGIQGSYRELTTKIKTIDKEVDKMVEDRRSLYEGVKKIKGELDSVHEPGKANMTQEAYDQFWNELLQLSVKLAEIEDLLEKNEKVTAIDLLELKKYVEGLARKLDSIEWVASKKS